MNVSISVLHPELQFFVILLSAFRLLVFSSKTQFLQLYTAMKILDLQKKKKKNKFLALADVGKWTRKVSPLKFCNEKKINLKCLDHFNANFIMWEIPAFVSD